MKPDNVAQWAWQKASLLCGYVDELDQKYHTARALMAEREAMNRANGNLPDDIREALKYLRTGGLGEVAGMADAARGAKMPKVQMDTDMALALCIMAVQSLPLPSHQLGDE